MIINHNIAALNTHRQLGANNAQASKNLEKLSSGLKINRAGDDAAGLAISEKMRSQIRGLDMAQKNSQDGISLIQTAEGSLNETHAILQRMRELSDQSANGTNTADDRKAMQNEVAQLKEEIDRIGNTTEFNTQKLLNGSLKSAGGASVGQNTTTGSAIAKMTAAEATSSNELSAIDPTADYTKEVLTIDGSEVEVNWQNLTTDEKAIINGATDGDAATNNKAAELIIRKINEAIDASGKNIAHITGYADGDMLSLKSGSTGVDSKIVSDGNGLVGALDGFTATDAVAGTSVVPSAIGSEAVDLKVNGVLMELTTAAVTADDDLSEVATNLETAINTAIKAYNDTTNKTTGQEGFIEDVTVIAGKDGRLSINSESGPVELADRAGTSAVASLGLSQAQTEASGNGGMTFQIGANKGQTITFGINDMRSAALGISGLDISSAEGSQNALKTLDSAISKVSAERSKLGAVQNRLEHTINNLGTSSENLTAAESRIRDVDYVLAAA